MSETESERCCGTCKWFELRTPFYGHDDGICTIDVPYPIAWYIEDAYTFASRGADCHFWEAK